MWLLSFRVKHCSKLIFDNIYFEWKKEGEDGNPNVLQQLCEKYSMAPSKGFCKKKKFCANFSRSSGSVSFVRKFHSRSKDTKTYSSSVCPSFCLFVWLSVCLYVCFVSPSLWMCIFWLQQTRLADRPDKRANKGGKERKRSFAKKKIKKIENKDSQIASPLCWQH